MDTTIEQIIQFIDSSQIYSQDIIMYWVDYASIAITNYFHVDGELCLPHIHILHKTILNLNYSIFESIHIINLYNNIRSILRILQAIIQVNRLTIWIWIDINYYIIYFIDISIRMDYI
jgi:hypothetical protein